MPRKTKGEKPEPQAPTPMNPLSPYAQDPNRPAIIE